MTIANFLNRILKRLARPVVENLLAKLQSLPTERARFALNCISAARSVAASGDQRILLPTHGSGNGQSGSALRVGLCGNIGNHPYNAAKSLRRLGHNVEVLIEDGGVDAFVLNRPFWEDVAVECATYDEGLTHEGRWQQPDFVRRVQFDVELQAQYQGRYSAIPEVQQLYHDAFGFALAPDRALLLAQEMGHWPYLLAMKAYDVVQFSAASLCMAPFCPRPHIAFPTGSDLFIAPFQETPFGFLIRCAYRSAAHTIVVETNYDCYLDRLGADNPRSFIPLLIDTVANQPGQGWETRQRWVSASGGRHFLLGVCRQSWLWKGSDLLLRAFRQFVNLGHDDWRLVLHEWGTDVAQSKQLIQELGLQSLVLWEPLCSKPMLRERQRAADVVADQFVMPGYGASVLESMAAAKPMLMLPMTDEDKHYLPELPPFIGGTTPEQIAQALHKVVEERAIEPVGQASLRWLLAYHGDRAVAPAYLAAYRAAVRGDRTGASRSTSSRRSSDSVLKLAS